MTEDWTVQRALAAAGLTLLLVGLLAALSLVVIAAAVFGLAVVVGLFAAARWARNRIDVRGPAEAGAGAVVAGVGAIRSRAPRPKVRRHAKRIGAAARSAARATPARSTALAGRAISGMYDRGLLKVHTVDPGVRAQQLNQLGARLRREGAPEQAADQHREALELVRDLGDPQAEAMTLNNLGLALAHSGSEAAAVEYLEQAADVLRELGDDEHEGQVIANLGVVYRRQGEHEQAATLFQQALAKIPADSPAHRQVERELLRAS